jgi:D-beta-D-heptose 7-phosphate kinase/D-beta-D-heptose 1-phosphate adenosyltransferase
MKIKKLNILLIGDSCKDIYIYGDANRLSPEAPIPVLDFNDINETFGMAKNVLNNLLAFGVNVDLVTNEENITKIRFVDQKTQHHLLRVDTNNSISPMQNVPSFNEYDCVVISDYDKGFINSQILYNIVHQCPIPIFIDSKKSVIPQKNNCFIKINNLEYNKLIDKNTYQNLIVTHGSYGAEYRGVMYPTRIINKGDVTGAGDTFFAALVFNYMNTKDIIDSIIFANKAANIAVSNSGTYALTPEDIKCLTANK